MSDKTRMNDDLPNDFSDDGELTGLEESLRGISLPPANVDRDELLYQAGWAAAIASQTSSAETLPLKRVGWGWQVATVLSTSAALLLGVMLLQTNTPDPLPGAIAKTSVNTQEELVDQNEQAVERIGARFDEVDLVRVVMEYPAGQTMSSSLGQLRKAKTIEPLNPKLNPESVRGSQWQIKNNRQMLNELLPSKNNS